MTVCSFAVHILCIGFSAGLGMRWKASQSGKPDSDMNRNAIHVGGDLFDFRGEALVVVLFASPPYLPGTACCET